MIESSPCQPKSQFLTRIRPSDPTTWSQSAADEAGCPSARVSVTKDFSFSLMFFSCGESNLSQSSLYDTTIIVNPYRDLIPDRVVIDSFGSDEFPQRVGKLYVKNIGNLPATYKGPDNCQDNLFGGARICYDTTLHQKIH